MIASDYLETMLPRELPKGFGYSDHSIGIHACVHAVQELGAPVIEKHFTLEHRMQFRGEVFRDTVHGATPEEFGKLASIIKR
jgi:sialic acid synthase SpsE